MLMLLDSFFKKRKNFAAYQQQSMNTQQELTPNQVRVGYGTEMSHEERHQWLKTRNYSETKPNLSSEN